MITEWRWRREMRIGMGVRASEGSSQIQPNAKENELGRVSFNSTQRISFGWDDTSLFTHTTQKSGWGVSGCFAQLTSRFHSSLPFLYLFLQPMGPKPTSPRAQFLLALSFQPIPNWPKLWHHVFPLLLLFISMNMKWC